jgi:hypothetical protein
MLVFSLNMHNKIHCQVEALSSKNKHFDYCQNISRLIVKKDLLTFVLLSNMFSYIHYQTKQYFIKWGILKHVYQNCFGYWILLVRSITTRLAGFVKALTGKYEHVIFNFTWN